MRLIDRIADLACLVLLHTAVGCLAMLAIVSAAGAVCGALRAVAWLLGL